MWSTTARRALHTAAAASSCWLSAAAFATMQSNTDTAIATPVSAPSAPVIKPQIKPIPNPRYWIQDALRGSGDVFRAQVGVEWSKAIPKLQNMMIVSGSSNAALAEEITHELHTHLGRVAVGRFADGEVSVEVLDNVRGKDVFLIQSTSPPVNENIMELLLMISTMRRSSAKSITAVIPYYGYKRDVGAPSTMTALQGRFIQGPPPGSELATDGQSTATGEGDDEDNESAYPVSAADVASMMISMGVDRVIAMDLQPVGQGQMEGFFPPHTPVENLRSTAVGVDHLARIKPPLRNPVVVAPNEACMNLATDFCVGLQRRFGSEISVGFAALIEAGRSRGMDRYLRNPKRRDLMDAIDLVGDVAGRDVILVDDMIDTGYTLARRVQFLKDRGANRIIAFATHGLFTGSALQRITKSALSDVIITNTIPLRDDVDVRHTHKIAQLTVAPLLAAAILRVQVGTSLQSLRVFEKENFVARYSGQE